VGENSFSLTYFATEGLWTSYIVDHESAVTPVAHFSEQVDSV
jgi:hypothetical protein